MPKLTLTQHFLLCKNIPRIGWLIILTLAFFDFLALKIGNGAVYAKCYLLIKNNLNHGITMFKNLFEHGFVAFLVFGYVK
ncbi:MAG: hypothetical protein ACRCT7_11140 [Shewanella sp.]